MRMRFFSGWGKGCGWRGSDGEEQEVLLKSLIVVGGRRGCCKIDINCLWSNGSIFMPIIRKAGSEEPAIHGIISYDE